MTKLPQFVRSRLAIRQTAPAEHPGASLLAAFAEQALSARERASVLEHLARCPECREVLAASSAPAADPPKPAIEWWKWRWAAAAAAAFLVAALFWRPGSFRHGLEERIAPAASPPSAPKKEKNEKPVQATSPVVASPRQFRAKPNPPAAAPQPALTLRQTVNLPPVTLNLAPPEPDRMVPQAASLEIREAVTDLPKISAHAQPETPAQSRSGAMALNGMFQSGAPTNLSKTRLRQFSRSEEGKGLWSLDGVLRKSADGGKTWRVVSVGSGNVRLYALSAAGSEIWAGGEGGALFHSTDGGLAWKLVIVTNAGGRLTDTITGIEARDANWIQLKTLSGDWLTTDGGRHWQRQ
ncbi:MAG TPA: YCF48-related protein [Bryobacteraceae bacterium]